MLHLQVSSNPWQHTLLPKNHEHMAVVLFFLYCRLLSTSEAAVRTCRICDLVRCIPVICRQWHVDTPLNIIRCRAAVWGSSICGRHDSRVMQNSTTTGFKCKYGVLAEPSRGTLLQITVPLPLKSIKSFESMT